MDYTYDSMFYSKGHLIAGLDESGVSDIAGPLVAACVILPKIDNHKHDLRILEVNDSKKIPEEYRKAHAEVIFKVALGIGIGEVTPTEIDYFGKYASIRLAMLRAINACTKPGGGPSLTPDHLLIDGSLDLPCEISQTTIEKGDTKSLAIASASIIAKVYRDDIMINLHEQFPEYNWASNKGYPCEPHFKGIDAIGVQLGIHRLKLWPFLENPKLNQDEKELWRVRRNLWRSVTESRTLKELGATEWITKNKFSKHLMSSKNLQEKAQRLSLEKQSKGSQHPTNSSSIIKP